MSITLFYFIDFMKQNKIVMIFNMGNMIDLLIKMYYC